ncbi:unannotated protein [freshwater metagenome]|uniref:Unannotated protein n=1 Tax=freshwater metagenome TaxID=449393 RepID=A0A6J6ZQM8_9ZZZZ
MSNLERPSALSNMALDRAAEAAHTSLISRRTTCAPEAIINPPINKIGDRTSMPSRNPTLSLTQPISGRISRPGIAHQDATENPTDLARAGIASERVENSPGIKIARTEVNKILARIDNQSVGARAKQATRTAEVKATPRRNLKMSAGSRRNSRVPNFAPTANPKNWKGSTQAAR